jgi:curli biogenesis system outer membrane secretion channel CsgG
MRTLLLLVSFFMIFFDGCSTHYINSLRDINQTQEFQVSQQRAFTIRYNETAYSQALEVYGEVLKKHLFSLGFTQAKINEMRFGVDNIYDKTGKVFPNSDGISDIVISAFVKLNLFPIVNLDKYSLNTYSNLHLRENFLSGAYKNSPYYANNPMMLSQLPIGVIKPTDYYIAGALLQYDRKQEDQLELDVKYFSVGKGFHIIDIGLDLRMVNSSLGVIVSSEEKGAKGASVSLTNRIITLSLDGEYFKLIHDDAYGLLVSSQVTDPTQYAVREIVELAVLELVSRLANLDWKETKAIEYIDKMHSPFVINKEH